ncbi:PREDICTED: immunoglobulin omega chain-like [Myotis brandtii]|uniref:immunoglobulin omega chain-like n=1 Tax=Myotis brandtii TaxID=109478 RepID=UPI000703D613|nr:PREDICTED: immunoglobulin omega chain-like [Myotis brandtii]
MGHVREQEAHEECGCIGTAPGRGLDTVSGNVCNSSHISSTAERIRQELQGQGQLGSRRQHSGPPAMAWLPLYLLPLVVSTGLCAAPVLTQPPSASAAPGASAKLTCTLSQEYSTYTIHWYHQRPGQAPRYIMYLTSSGSQGKGAGIPDRFSGSSSGADRYLTISSIQSEDEAEYICGADYSISGQYGFHSDTHKREGCSDFAPNEAPQVPLQDGFPPLTL